jgi:mannosyltransferase
MTTVRTNWPVFLVLVIGLVSGFRGIENQDLWYDELETAFAVNTRLSGALDPYTLPYYLLLQLFTAGGSYVTDLTLRAPSAVAMALAAALVAATARAATKSNVASVLAGSFLVLAPGSLRLAQEARPYAFATLGCALALYLLIRILQGDSRKLWCSLTLTVLLSTVVAPIVIFIIPSLFFLLITDKRHLAVRFLKYFAWVVPVLILGVVASTQFSDLRSWLDSPSILGLREAPIWVSTSDTHNLYGTSAFALALLALTTTTRRGLQCFASIMLGIGTIWIGSFGPMSFWTGRTFIILLPILAFGASLAFARASWPRGLIVVALLAVFVQPAHAQLREPGNRGTSWSAVAAEVASLIRTGDRTGDRLLFLSVHHYQPKVSLGWDESGTGFGIWSSSSGPCSNSAQSGGTDEAMFFVCRDSIGD